MVPHHHASSMQPCLLPSKALSVAMSRPDMIRLPIVTHNATFNWCRTKDVVPIDKPHTLETNLSPSLSLPAYCSSLGLTRLHLTHFTNMGPRPRKLQHFRQCCPSTVLPIYHYWLIPTTKFLSCIYATSVVDWRLSLCRRVVHSCNI